MIASEMANEMNDHLVIVLAKEGNRQAFRQLYEIHRERIYRLAYRYMKNQQDAEDVMQETFIKAFKNIKHFRAADHQALVSWLNRIAVNNAIGQLRKHKRRKINLEESITEMKVEPYSETASPESKTLTGLAITRIKNALYDLSPKQQVIFNMRHLQHLAIQEIAQNLDCSQSSIKKHLFRAVAKLQKKLAPILEEK